MARNQSERNRNGPKAIAYLPGWTVELRAHDEYYYVKDERGVLIDVRSSLKMALEGANRAYDARVMEARVSAPVPDDQPWRWSDVDNNDLDSMSDGMEVLITAKQLRALIEQAANPHRAMRPGTLSRASRNAFYATFSAARPLTHGTKQK